MKNNRLSLLTTGVMAVTAIIAGAARAEELSQTKARQQFSITHGLGATSLNMLRRASAAGPDEVSAALIEKLRPETIHTSTNDAGTLRISGEEWSLTVSSDGTAVEYRDLAVEASAHSLGRSLSEKMTAAELEQKGRAFIASRLASQIILSANEEMIALRADYRTEGGQDLTTGKITTAVVANRIVFGRVRDGVPVVGNGSKISITFTNDGSLESFRYDWPVYEAGAAQNAANVSEVLSRLQRVLAVRSGDAGPAPEVPATGDRAYPLALTGHTQLQSLECGYYDAGFRVRQSQFVQAGCAYLAVSQDASGMRQGYAGAIPAADSFTEDAAWLETRILGGR
jgi:hypothetical protein